MSSKINIRSLTSRQIQQHQNLTEVLSTTGTSTLLARTLLSSLSTQTHVMQLLDLPTEILQTITEQSVITLGLRKAQRLRLVNSMFLFA